MKSNLASSVLCEVAAASLGSYPMKSAKTNAHAHHVLSVKHKSVVIESAFERFIDDERVFECFLSTSFNESVSLF